MSRCPWEYTTPEFQAALDEIHAHQQRAYAYESDGFTMGELCL